MSTFAPNLHGSIDLLSYSSGSSTGEIARLLKTELDRLDVTVTRRRKLEAADSVIDTFRTHQRENWDGYGAVPLSQEACAEAIIFLRQLPSGIPRPDVIPNPDGDVSLEWYLGKWHLFVLTFSGKGIIFYAGVFGKGKKTHGTEFISDSIPSSIVENLCRLLAHTKTA